MNFLPAHLVLLFLLFATLLLSAIGVVISRLAGLFALLPWLIG
jgi:hypothetical protein